MKLRLHCLAVAVSGIPTLIAAVSASADTYYVSRTIAAPTAATRLIYAPDASALVLKNTSSAIAVVDLIGGTSSLRFSNTRFTDIALSPSGNFVFAADYGGENIGYGTPSTSSYVHRLDLVSRTWDLRSSYIAGNIQAVSDTQVLLSSLDQWVTFTNNSWGTGPALTVLNSTNSSSPGYYPGVYSGNFAYDPRTGRLIHGNSGLSSQEVQAFKLINNQFVKQEGSGTYGSANGYGGSVVLSTDGSAFYYGRLQIDPLDVTHNVRVFPEVIYAATGQFAFGNGNYYDAHTGGLLGALPFKTTVYGLNRNGTDLWAYDPSSSTLNYLLRTSRVDPVWDVFWRRNDGTNVVWQFTGPALTQFAPATLPGVPPTWSAIGTGDINGDHERDVVWIQPGTGQVAIWLMGYPTTIMTVSFPANLGAATTMTLAGLGDFNGDGRADLVWRDTATGELRVWYMNAAGAIASSASYGIVPLQFELRGIGDFNNDGIADLLWYRPTDGVTAQWLMAPDGGFTAAFPGAVGAGTWRPYRVADFDGDGNADIFWRDEATGMNAVWYMNGGTLADFDFFASAPPSQWELGAAGDFDLDGRSDLLWYSQSMATAVRWTMKGRHSLPVSESLGVGTNWHMLP